MALTYSCLFPNAAPNLEKVVEYVLANTPWLVDEVEQEEKAIHLLFQNELILSITPIFSSGSRELVTGCYAYDTYWSIRYGKLSTSEADEAYVIILSYLVENYNDNFLSLFNGEQIILYKESGHVYLNKLCGLWNSQELLSFFGAADYEFADYVVV